MDRELLIQRAKIELAKREFFFYCNLKAPEFYKEDRTYLVEFCNDLQNFIASEDDVLVINLPASARKEPDGRVVRRVDAWQGSDAEDHDGFVQ